jgi:hypothetical protein
MNGILTSQYSRLFGDLIKDLPRFSGNPGNNNGQEFVVLHNRDNFGIATSSESTIIFVKGFQSIIENRILRFFNNLVFFSIFTRLPVEFKKKLGNTCYFIFSSIQVTENFWKNMYIFLKFYLHSTFSRPEFIL